MPAKQASHLISNIMVKINRKSVAYMKQRIHSMLISDVIPTEMCRMLDMKSDNIKCIEWQTPWEIKADRINAVYVLREFWNGQNNGERNDIKL